MCSIVGLCLWWDAHLLTTFDDGLCTSHVAGHTPVADQLLLWPVTGRKCSQGITLGCLPDMHTVYCSARSATCSLQAHRNLHACVVGCFMLSISITWSCQAIADQLRGGDMELDFDQVIMHMSCVQRLSLRRVCDSMLHTVVFAQAACMTDAGHIFAQPLW